MPKSGGNLIRPILNGETSTTINTAVSSFEEEDDVKVMNVVNAMDLKAFIKLRRHFFNPCLPMVNSVSRNAKERLSIGEVISRTEFVMALENIIGQSGIAASRLFDEVDSKQRGYISWPEFLDHSLQMVDAQETTGKKLILSRKVDFYEIKHFTKTDAIAKILPLKIGSEQRYEVVSKRGLVNRCNAEFNRLTSKGEYAVPLWACREHSSSTAWSLAAPRPLQSSKAALPWITDVTFMEDVNVIVFAASDRSLHFRDVGGRGFPWMFHVSGLRSAPTCMAYMSPGREGGGSATGSTTSLVWMDSVLLFGDEAGNVWTLKFLQPQESLFHRSRRKGEGAERIRWRDLERVLGLSLGEAAKEARRVVWGQKGIIPRDNVHGRYVELSVAWGMHKSAVSQVSFCGSSPFAVASCSSTDCLSRLEGRGASLVLKTESSRATPYVFSIPSGISCFDLWENAEGLDCFLLATGSSDALIRLWNPYDPRRATANLTGHKGPIKDMAFLRKADLMVLITVCSEGELRIWKTSDGGCHEHSCCLQVVPINFSAISSLNKSAQFGCKVLYIQENEVTTLLVACGSEVAAIELTSQDETRSLEHEAEEIAGESETPGEGKSPYQELLQEEEPRPSNTDSSTACGMPRQSIDGSMLQQEVMEVFHRISDQTLSVFSRATEFTRPVKKCLGVNQQQLLQQKHQKEMRKFVSICIPHLALPIYSPIPVSSQPTVKHPCQLY